MQRFGSDGSNSGRGRCAIKGDDVERVLPNIDANHGDRVLSCRCGHSVLLVWAPLTSLSLAGQEHGRTIPLADIGAYAHLPRLLAIGCIVLAFVQCRTR